MVRNRKSNDEDFVPQTQYPKRTTRPKKKPPPKPSALPDFDPVPIDNNTTYGRPNIPEYIDTSDPYAIFRLFFTDELLDKLAEFTNRNAELHPTPLERQPKDSPRPWKPTCRQELLAYLAVLFHMGIHTEPSTEDYWNSSLSDGPIHGVGDFISCNRWEQLDRYFYCTKPKEQDDTPFQNTFQRVEDLSEHLRLCCRRLYKPGIHLAVDESIERFTGRASEIVNIPTKPIPEGFKIWILGNQGYVLDWMFHAKGAGKGPYDLDTSFVKDGFTKTEAVVLDLLLQEDVETKERLYTPRQHVVWLDNLFTSIKLLQRLREEGIGAAGTVRTVKTQREEQEDLTPKRKEHMSPSLIDLKLIHEGQIPWGTLYAELSNNGQVLELAWKDSKIVLFMSTVGKGMFI